MPQPCTGLGLNLSGPARTGVVGIMKVVGIIKIRIDSKSNIPNRYNRIMGIVGILGILRIVRII